MGRLGNYAITFITTIMTIVGFVGFVTSKPLDAWTKTHSEVVFFGFIVFFMATGASFNYFLEEKKKYQKLKESTARVEPSEHDRKLFKDFMAMLPPDGSVIVWLKETSVPDAFLRKDFEAFEAALRGMEQQSLQFDNSKVEVGYGQLHEAMQKFENVTMHYMLKDPGGPWLQLPSEWDRERSDKAAGEINQIRLDLTRKYGKFLDLAHQDGIDQ
jgi:hypothetical protein